MKKLTIIGGGSVRAPFFANSLAKRAHTLHISTLCLYDIDSEKLRVIGSIAKHAVAKIAPDLQVILETDLTKAITGTDYFVTTIRVGGDHSRVGDHGRRRVFYGRPVHPCSGGLLSQDQRTGTECVDLQFHQPLWISDPGHALPRL